MHSGQSHEAACRRAGGGGGKHTDGGETRGDKTEQKVDRTEAASITDAGRA